MNKKPYIIAFFFFIIDLISKQVAQSTLKLHESIEVIKNFFYLTLTKNSGAAWSILKDKKILLLIITMIVLYLIYRHLNKEKINHLESLIYGIIIGGIIGNLFDRIVYGSVIDFLDFKIFGYNYPIFNLADTFIVVGIILLIIISIRKEHYEKNNSK